MNFKLIKTVECDGQTDFRSLLGDLKLESDWFVVTEMGDGALIPAAQYNLESGQCHCCNGSPDYVHGNIRRYHIYQVLSE